MKFFGLFMLATVACPQKSSAAAPPLDRRPSVVALTHFLALQVAGQVPGNEPAGGSAGERTTAYKLSGHRTVLPVSVRDDGARTFIEWHQSQPVPAVFGVDERGREELVNGRVRDNSFTIDRVYPRLVFRIDRAQASARRRSGRRR